MPIIVTSGDLGPAARPLALASRDRFLMKPYSFDRVAHEIAQRCGR
jgi:hypothetical protein